MKLSNLTEEQAATFAVRRHLFSGVDIQEALSRYYPFGEASAHAIGYVGSISAADLERIDRSNYAGTSHIGKTGIERAYEDRLHGQVGYRQQVVNAQGRVLEAAGDGDGRDSSGVEAKSPVPGQNVVLSLDMKLQLAAQEAMQDLRGAVVAIDPRNGDVLALVSTPAFDPNRFAAGPEPRRLRRADRGSRQAALQPRARAAFIRRARPSSRSWRSTALQHEADRRPSEERYCPGRLPACRARRTATATGGRRATATSTCAARSCSRATSTSISSPIAMGIDTIARRAHGSSASARRRVSTSAARSRGVVPSREWKKKQFTRREDQVWFPGETVITGIGQGYMLVTPMQLASAARRSRRAGNGSRRGS